jgi:lauroyl/myristoyl acyltransferase
MKQLNLFDKISYFILKLFLGVILIAPYFVIRGICSFIYSAGRPFAGKDLRILQKNLDEVLNLPQNSHFATMFEKQVFKNQIICMIESFIATQKPSRIKTQGYENLEQIVKKHEAAGKGQIIVTAHIGSWEQVANFVSNALATPFLILAKPSKNMGVTKFLDDVRSDMDVKILWTGKSSIIKDMFKNLRANGALGFVMDQKPEGRKGPKVKFFERDTYFVSGPAAMSMKTDCGVIGVYVVREGPFSYRIVSEEIFPPGHGIKDEEVLTQAMAKSIESVIRMYPEQWCWNYKRWRFA